MGHGANNWAKRRVDTGKEKAKEVLLSELNLSPIEQDLLEIIDSLEKRLFAIEQKNQLEK